jgi:eukaryotic-like serine/threonine-protein kinase
MEYLAGIDLKDLLRQRGRLDSGFAVDLALQGCEALAEAHAMDIVHRDVKPSNFFLTKGADGAPLLKLLDFGVSKSSSTMIKGITKTQTIIGTPAYMSPEQMASSKNVDARTDIWSLGVVLYELVSGRRPFRGDNFGRLVVQVTTRPIIPLDDIELPDGLAAVITRCLEKDAAHRFQSMTELAAALAPYAATPSQATRSTERTARVLELATGSAVVPRNDAKDAPDESSGPSDATIRESSGERTPPPAMRHAGPAPRPVATATDPHSTSAITARRERPRQRLRPALAVAVAAVLGMAAALAVVMRAEPATVPASVPATVPVSGPAPAAEPAHAPAPGSASPTAADDVAAHAPAAAVQHLLSVDAGAPPAVEAHADQSPAPPPAPERADRPPRRNRRKPSTDTAPREQRKLEDAFGTRN